MRQPSDELRRFILEDARKPAAGLAKRVIRRFGISRQTASANIRRLVLLGQIEETTTGREKKYRLVRHNLGYRTIPLSGLQEDVLWREQIAPLLSALPENVRNIWHYGFTEMVNNAIDHSGGTQLNVWAWDNVLDTEIWITDDGEGIFHRIQRVLGLYDPREAILELAKGKLTTDPANHTGEGIFFTSRSFDHFSILSRNLYFSHHRDRQDWLIEDEGDSPGTQVRLVLSKTRSHTLKSVMDQFAAPDDFAFSKTVVPVTLARHEGEKLVSRSQAKRLVARFERFETVVLDFNRVEEIGQAFADEIFRVFVNAHPSVALFSINVELLVQQMINRVQMVNIIAKHGIAPITAARQGLINSHIQGPERDVQLPDDEVKPKQT